MRWLVARTRWSRLGLHGVRCCSTSATRTTPNTTRRLSQRQHTTSRQPLSFDLGNGISIDVGRRHHSSTDEHAISATKPGYGSLAPLSLETLAAPQLSALREDLSSSGQSLLSEDAVMDALRVLTNEEVLSASVSDVEEEVAAAVKKLATSEAVLHAVLKALEVGSRCTGRRYTGALDASVVFALWATAIPALSAAWSVERGPHLRRALAAPPVATDAALTAEPTTALTSIKAIRTTHKQVMRALSLRTRTLVDQFDAHPDVLILMLVRMQQCGVLSDDVLGPIGTHLANQHARSSPNDPAAPSNHSLLARHIIARPESVEALPFQGSVAVTFARLLGRQYIPAHFQLHQVLHTVVLPVLRQELDRAVVALQSTQASPSGTDVELPTPAVLQDLTQSFVRYHVSGHAVEALMELWSPHVATFGLSQCVHLLRILTRPPLTQQSPRYQRRRGGGGVQNELEGRRSTRSSSEAEEEFLPLIHHLVQRLASLTGDDGEPVTAVESMEALMVLSQANCADWGAAYIAVAGGLLHSLQQGARDGSGVPLEQWWPLETTCRTVRAVLRRNSMIPDHVCHRVLLKRILHAPEALADPAVANVALVGMSIMTWGSGEISPTTHTSTDSAPAVVEASLAATRWLSEATLTAEDEAAALRLFRRHGTSLSLPAFSAAMSVVPVEQLPPESQLRVVNHFTTIVSALSPRWMVCGVIAAAKKIPQSLDPVSLQRWLGRLHSLTVVRKLDLSGCAGLLELFAQRPDIATSSALAKHAVVNQVGRLLRAEEAAGEGLAVLPTLIASLHEANVFYAYLYSRMCRMLLGEAQRAPWGVLLPAFQAAAEEFGRRPPSEGRGSVFRDVWELIRQRIMSEAGASLSFAETLSAINAFAALDGGDRALFLVLTHRLWVTMGDEMAAAERPSSSATHDPNTATTHVVDVGVGPEELERMAHARQQLISTTFATLTPSALVSLAITLLYMRRGETVEALLPGSLLSLAAAARDVYPIDVVMALPALLRAFTEATAEDGVSRNTTDATWNPLLIHLLHGAYDACRTTFLQMYQILPDPPQSALITDPTNGCNNNVENSGVVVVDADGNDVAALRSEWTPKVHASIRVVPRWWFAAILAELSACGLQDEVVATACAAQACTRRQCGEMLTIQRLVELCMSLCSQRSSTTTADSTSTSYAGYMKVVLDALWARTDELSKEQVHALLRCLRFYFGDKVDADFVQRLEGQAEALERPQGVRGDGPQPTSKPRDVVDPSTTVTASMVCQPSSSEAPHNASTMKVATPPSESVNISAQALFDDLDDETGTL